MKRVYDQELKKIQLEILDVVADFCDKNNISYWIDSGTLLGAIRHKGYIPWDDDIDLGMLRPDFDRFMELFNRENPRYQFYSVENNPSFLYPFGKVLDLETILYEPDKNGNKLSINIDIFVYDNILDEKAAEIIYSRRDKYQKLHFLRNFKPDPSSGLVTVAKSYAMKLLLKLLPANHFIKKLSENSKTYCKEETDYVGNFTAYTKMLCHKRVFSEFITAEFEGKHYRVPVGYDEWLRCFYGDYMQLPPVEKRVSHHKFEAYIKE